MQSSTYKDIIDTKIAEWQKGIKTLEEQSEKVASDTQVQLVEKVRKLKSAVDTATVQLYDLDQRESVSNTMETKDKILKIFGSVDRDFTKHEDKTPFML